MQRVQVLWIDDEPIRAALIPDAVLQKVQITFAHGQDQIQFCTMQHNLTGIKYDLIVIDHDMPLMNGLDVCKKFFEYGAPFNVPILLCSNNEPARDRMYDYLTRPIEGFEIRVLSANISSSTFVRIFQRLVNEIVG